ncbi:DUF72 domain-containing protein [Candidatus Nitrosotenuis cloacae]|uniref:DUF72 domain-containing protein n=1 Tax=Candidatus Nitrosotenuis cloacae TaxID=1603555 RepID=UPI001F236564|nr:DUF72 domain-containing protein [Candidatus Nitrosotenuis cloacae]
MIEGRHTSWFSDSAISYLSDRKVCLVWSDVAGVNNTAPLTSDFVYVILIGDRSIPESQFGKLQKDQTPSMKSWIAKLQKIQDRISYATILVNNRYEGFGPATANRLRLLLGLESLQFTDRHQKTLF